MGFFDKVTKAVGDAVDKGKKDIDQFMRIQKINGEISASEAKVAELKTQIQQNNQEAGQKAIALVKAGRLASPDLEAFVGTLNGIEQQIAAEEATILAKKADIDRIKSEHEAEHATAAPAASASAPAVPAAPATPPPTPAAVAPAAPPPLPVTPPPDGVPATPVVPPRPRASACPQCGKPLTGGAFCTECGAKIG
jgi:TolA-binding protein